MNTACTERWLTAVEVSRSAPLEPGLAVSVSLS